MIEPDRQINRLHGTRGSGAFRPVAGRLRQGGEDIVEARQLPVKIAMGAANTISGTSSEATTMTSSASNRARETRRMCAANDGSIRPRRRQQPIHQVHARDGQRTFRAQA